MQTFQEGPPPAKRARRTNAIPVDVDLDNRPIEDLYTELSTPGEPVQPRVPQPPKFECTMCSAKFPRKNAVVAHIKTHLGKKKFVCSHPGWYVLPSCFSHVRRTDVKCSEMAFVREHDCKRHETTHTGKRTYVCYWCVSDIL